MSGNTAPLIQSTSLSAPVINPVSEIQSILTPIEPEKPAAGLRVLRRDMDSQSEPGGQYALAFKSFPNTGDEEVTPSEARAAASIVITKLQNAAVSADISSKSDVTLDQPPFDVLFIGTMEGLSIESLLFTLQGFLMGHRMLVHVSSKDTLDRMQKARDGCLENQKALFDQRIELAEKERQKGYKIEKTEVWRDVAWAAVGIGIGLALLPGAMVAIGGAALWAFAGAGLSLAAGTAGLVKAYCKYQKVEAIEQGKIDLAKRWAANTEVASKVEMVVVTISIAVDIYLVVGWIRNLKTVGKGAAEAVEHISMRQGNVLTNAKAIEESVEVVNGVEKVNRQIELSNNIKSFTAANGTATANKGINGIYELSDVKKIVDTNGKIVGFKEVLNPLAETAEVVKEGRAASNAVAIELLKNESGVYSLPDILKEILGKFGWKNIGSEELKPIVQAAFEKTQEAFKNPQSSVFGKIKQLFQRPKDIVYGEKVSEEFMKLFSRNLTTELHSTLLYNSPNVQKGFALLRVGGVTLAAFTQMQIARLRSNVAESRFLVDELDAHIAYERNTRQIMLQKMIRDEIEQMQRNAEEMAKTLKNTAEWCTQIMEAKTKTIGGIAFR